MAAAGTAGQTGIGRIIGHVGEHAAIIEAMDNFRAHFFAIGTPGLEAHSVQEPS